jgi:hypothetical protein
MTEPEASTLRPYQHEALRALDEHIAHGFRRLVIVLPTGCGKGYLTAQLPGRLGTPLLLLAVTAVSAVTVDHAHHLCVDPTTTGDFQRRGIMKHARSDYNNTDLDLHIPDDEPVFLIRAQDVVAGDAVRAWADLNDAAGGDPKLSRLAREHANLMDQWPKKKHADL